MLAKFLQGGASAAAPNYIEDVFQTWLYDGNSASRTINNGVDLAGKGGLVWIKTRTQGGTGWDHVLYDTDRGPNKYLSSNLTNAQNTSFSNMLTGFNSGGFSLGNDATTGLVNNTLYGGYASWTFRKQPKFFDVVTYTGNSTAGRTVAHNLGSVPGCIIIKETNNTGVWYVYHRSVGNTGILQLQSTAATVTSSTYWNNTSPTATEFTLGGGSINNSTVTYVAYLFAHDAGGFGASGSDNVISCGYAASGTTVNLGWEPQWILIKDPTQVDDWRVFDSMRGILPANISTSPTLAPNKSTAEANATGYVGLTSTGFYSGTDNIYIAIRRGPMRTPTTGTSVFDPEGIVTVAGGQTIQTGFVTDMTMAKFNGTQEWLLSDRLRNAVLYPNTTGSEGSLYADAGPRPFDVQNGYKITSLSGSYALWGFRRAPGFLDVVCYTGTGANRTVNHNLGVVPEMMIVKQRNSSRDWVAYIAPMGNNYFACLNDGTFQGSSSTMWNDTTPTASVFTVGTNIRTNTSAGTYVAYLFATVAGVSKVGSYTGNGSSQTINCGFTGGARFVLIKRTDSTGDWYVWDTARGIVSANDPHLSLNSTTAEVTTNDSIDPDNSGFIVNQVAATNINVNAATYIYLAIA